MEIGQQELERLSGLPKLFVSETHRLKHRIDAHICISFVAYCIYKELERVLALENSSLSVRKQQN